MCGIVGYWSDSMQNGSHASQILSQMTDMLVHRGPDSSGQWLDCDSGIALGHSRLSIVDLNPTGSQPMMSASKRYVLTFNGEIYNHADMRRKLETFRIDWRGRSDTEVMLAAIDVWGIERALKESDGMFSLAVWDRMAHTLSLARDRIGEKPLYYGWQGKTFLFASELKALERHPDFRRELRHQVLSGYLRRGYISAPLSIWNGIWKLEPGMIFTMSPRLKPAIETKRQYWSLAELYVSARNERSVQRDEEAILDDLEKVLAFAVRRQSVADVPVGAFLSGGIDSSLVVALMQAQSSVAVETFCIGFDQAKFNEAPFAKEVARYLGANFNCLHVTGVEAQSIIPHLPRIYDEPFGDSSQIPTCVVAALAKQRVKVVLSGDGGDEVFGGYSRYSHIAKLIKVLDALPRRVRLANSLVLKHLIRRFVPAQFYPDVLLKLERVLAVHRHVDSYAIFCDQAHRDYVVNGLVSREVQEVTPNWPEIDNLIETMMFVDTLTSLPDDILTKVDRATMSVSLEARAPLLDHRVLDFAWKLPFDMRFRNGQSKWALRRVLERYVPKSLVDRPKVGFAVPLAEWLRGDLKEWAGALLSQSQLKRDNIFQHRAVISAWREHQDRTHDHSAVLWNLLMFQTWLDRVRV
jgi:asparagine synthase (glutamine-hydrolysing)